MSSMLFMRCTGMSARSSAATQSAVLRFFISAATVWREKIRDELLTTQVKVDVHAPASARATVPIQNMDEFHEAFDIGPGDPMYLPPDERIVIW